MSSKQVENVEFEFDPEGLRVLAVDDSAVCLRTLVALLEKCRYKVSATTDANEALKWLRENKDRFDIVLTDVMRPDMDGFTLMEIIRDEMDIPVILLSASDDRKNVMKGVNKGAGDYLLKPPRMEEIKNIWQHVARKKLLDHRAKATYDVSRHHYSSNKVAKTNADENKESSSKDKKRRVHWTPEMHAKFVEVVHTLGVFTGAVPKKILELMSQYPGLTRENVASHLQKYRRTLLTQKNGANDEPNTAAGNHLLLAAVPPVDTTCPEAAYQQRPDQMQGYNQITHPGKHQNPQHALVQQLPHFQGHRFAAAEHQGMIMDRPVVQPPVCQFPERNRSDNQNRLRLFDHDPQHYYQPQQCGEHNHMLQVYSHIPGYGSYVSPVSCFRPSEVLPSSIPSLSGLGTCLPDNCQMPGLPPNFSSTGIENQGFGQQVPEDTVTETSFSSFSSADDEIANLMVEFNRNGGATTQL